MVDKAALRKLIYWMEERQKIYLQRQAGVPPPWTRDPVLQRYRFCNVYREQDRETAWLRENWREPYRDHPNLWFACCMFRQINWSPTLAEIGFPETWDPRRVMRVLQNRWQRQEKVYTSAYLIPSRGFARKIEYTVRGVLHPLWKACVKNPMAWDTLERAFQQLSGFYGWGPFLTYEVITDLRHTRYLQNASDIATWANAGPGARRGLNRLYGRPLRYGQNAKLWLSELLEVMDGISAEADRTLLPTLEPRDVEHSLCEYDKMERALERERNGSRCGLEVFHGSRLV